MKCIGYGKYERKCDGVAGTKTGKWWCERCEKLRLENITKSMKTILEKFENKLRDET
jgi:hypothetical protein